LAASPDDSPPPAPDQADPFAKICDVLGSGYTLIPGTTTCIKVGGYVRLDVGGAWSGDRSAKSPAGQH